MRPFRRRVAVDTWYCLSGLPIALVRLGVLLAGLPLVVPALLLARPFAAWERRRLGSILGGTVIRPAYARVEARGVWRLLAPVGDGQRWRDLAYGIVGVVPALVGSVLALAWWMSGLAGCLYFFWGRPIPPAAVWPPALGLRTFGAVALMNTALGLLLLATGGPAVRVLALGQAAIARALLAPSRVTELRERVEELATSRDAAISAEAGALRRLERDIHDGPQQRLIRLSMDLSLARRRLRTDSDAVGPLLSEAIDQAREALEELRALSRGIAPPILADRGLAAALAALAARSTVPVQLDVALPERVRLPSASENAAYFLVAEALTNVAKHSGAGRCDVRVAVEAGRLLVRVADDGGGGAHVSKGHGLAGLADRLRAVGGRLDVGSPPGGPTVLTAALPCE